MINMEEFKDAPSVRKAIKSLTAKVARLNMAFKKAKGTDKEAARKEAYDAAVADREALRKKLEEFHAEIAAKPEE